MECIFAVVSTRFNERLTGGARYHKPETELRTAAKVQCGAARADRSTWSVVLHYTWGGLVCRLPILEGTQSEKSF